MQGQICNPFVFGFTYLQFSKARTSQMSCVCGGKQEKGQYTVCTARQRHHSKVIWKRHIKALHTLSTVQSQKGKRCNHRERHCNEQCKVHEKLFIICSLNKNAKAVRKVSLAGADIEPGVNYKWSYRTWFMASWQHDMHVRPKETGRITTRPQTAVTQLQHRGDREQKRD